MWDFDNNMKIIFGEVCFSWCCWIIKLRKLFLEELYVIKLDGDFNCGLF